MHRAIQLIKNDYSKNYNSSFNSKLKSISDEIFQTEEIFPAGYIPIGNYLREKVDFSANRLADQHITTVIGEDKIDSSWDALSEYEKIIASHLLYGFYNAYIFSGGMGSGKTSTATHVLNFIKSKFSSANSAFINIAFDFNLGVLNEDENNGQNIIDRFKQELYIKLKVAIHTYIKDHEKDVVRNLWRHAEKRSFEGYSEYFDLGNLVNEISWLDLSPTKRANQFIAFIETNPDKINRIEMFMKFFKFLKSDLSENEFIILFYDNIDVLQPYLQKKIFHDYILPLNTIARTKCLISLRKTTFLRTFDYRDIRFAQSYGFIHHHGHKVSDIVSQRLIYWKNNIDSHKLFQNMDQRYREAFKKRISYLQKEFTFSHPHSLPSYLDALAGNCVRLGLYISHRLLINNIIKFDENPLQRDRYKKALIVSVESNTLLSDLDEVVNLFAVNGLFSLLPIRILQLVAKAESKDGIKIENILATFSKVYSEEAIFNTLKILLYSRRPLLWINSTDSNDRLDLQASAFMTEIGFGYYNYLIDDLTYIQECFIVAKWDTDIVSISVDLQNEYERLSTVIKCLRVVFDNEFETIGSLYSHNTYLISIRMIEKIVEAIITLNIAAGFKQLYTEIEDLLTYLLSVKNIHSNQLEELLQHCTNLKQL